MLPVPDSDLCRRCGHPREDHVIVHDDPDPSELARKRGSRNHGRACTAPISTWSKVSTTTPTSGPGNGSPMPPEITFTIDYHPELHRAVWVLLDFPFWLFCDD